MVTTGTASHSILKVNGQQLQKQEDKLAVEEPLQIQLQLHTNTGRLNKNIAVTMRTPGNDAELAAGFLFTEGIITNMEQVDKIIHSNNHDNRITVVLKNGIAPDLKNTERNFYTTSSCGICGKASIDAVTATIAFTGKVHFTVTKETLYSLPDKLREQQHLFETTGGLHAAALFNNDGSFILLKEDVGRHNALDKLIGALFTGGQLPLSNKILLLSGRASFELVQKAAMAGIKMIAAAGAPSSLAVELAEENNMTLVGFLRTEKFNIYCGSYRVKL